jgi:hypothetical protein
MQCEVLDYILGHKRTQMHDRGNRSKFCRSDNNMSFNFMILILVASEVRC